MKVPDKPIRKGFDILEEAERIRSQKRTLPHRKESIDSIESRLISALRMQWHTSAPKYFASDIWRELLEKTRNYPKPEFRDEISELRQEVDTLKLMFKSLTKNIESSNKTIDDLSREIRQEHAVLQTASTSLKNLCNAYVEIVSNIEIVKNIYIVDNIHGLSCWTIIDAEPFDSELRAPIYDAQLKIYQDMKEGIALDFHVLNLSELHDRQELESILPPSAKLVWQR